MGLKSWDKFIPEAFIYNSTAYRLELLRGLLDGDGYVGDAGYIEYSTVSERLKDNIITLVRGLGGRASFTKREGWYTNNGIKHKARDNYRVWISFPAGSELPVSSIKHTNRYKEILGHKRRFISEINFVGREETVCITTTAKDSCFLTTDYCVTHNSAFVTTMIKNAAHAGWPSAIASLEMTKFEVTCRLVTEDVELFISDLSQRRLTPEQAKWFRTASEALKELPITIDDNSKMHINDLEQKAREWKRKYGIQLLVVDYLQLMSGDSKNREQEIGEISRGLKRIAKDNDIPVIALSQLNRSVETRDNKRPMMSDLRESGSIEQDADAVFFLYRPEYYYQIAGEECPPELRGICQFITGKFRNGITADLIFKFVGEYSTFRDREDLNVKL